jgi:hypothetical protein
VNRLNKLNIKVIRRKKEREEERKNKRKGEEGEKEKESEEKQNKTPYLLRIQVSDDQKHD